MQPQQPQDPNMQQGGQPQPQTPQANSIQQANQAKANLGFVNTMQEQLLQHKANKNGHQAVNSAPGSTQTPETTKEQPEDEKQSDLAKELTSFKTEIEGLIDSKLGDLKREIETALKDEPDEQEKTPTTA